MKFKIKGFNLKVELYKKTLSSFFHGNIKVKPGDKIL